MSTHTFQPLQGSAGPPCARSCLNWVGSCSHIVSVDMSQPPYAECNFLAGNCPGPPAHVQRKDVNHDADPLPSGSPPEDVWRAEGVQTPHDIALTAAPTPSKGNGDRAVAVLIAETRMRGSSLRKFILLPEGTWWHLIPWA